MTFTEPQQKFQASSQVELQEWLAANQIPLTLWGTKDTKTVSHLWQEVHTGEAQLFTQPVCRVVKVVQVEIIQARYRLLEHMQILQDGRQRRRNMPLAEKIKAGESPLTAARRGIKEELAKTINEADLTQMPIEEQYRWDHSPSYPGLATRYQLYSLTVTTDQLPKGPFTTTEYTDNTLKQAIIHHWIWQPLACSN